MINLIRNIIALAAIALVASACSTMNKGECINADWDTIGYGDGTNGYPASRLSQHRSACAEHGVKPNLNAYTNGRNKGLNQYCIPSRGYYKGLAGSGYNGVCTNHNEKAYLEAHGYGYNVYKQQKVLDGLKSDLRGQEDLINNLENQLNFNERRITSGKLTKLKTYKLLQENKKLTADITNAEASLDPISHDINQQSLHIADLKANKAF